MEEYTILIIDADLGSRNFLTRTLQQQHFTVHQASSGREGLISAWRDKPHIIIVDPVLPDMAGIDFINRLRQDQRTADIPCIALTLDADSDRAAKLLESGYNEYLIKSLQAIMSLQYMIPNLLSGKRVPNKDGGLLVVFLSAKGGTGVSTLCANIAQNIAQGKPVASVAVVDMVLPIGSIAEIVGYHGSMNLIKVTDMPVEQISGDFFKKNLPELPIWRFRLLAGSPDPETASSLQVERISNIVDTLLGTFHYVVIDMGRTLSRVSLPVIKQADLIALILSTDISTVTLTKTILDYLRSNGIDQRCIYPILNRAVGLEGLTKTEAEKIIDINIRTTMPYMSSDFTLANNQNLPYTTKFKQNTSSLILQQTASEMTELAHKLRAQ